MSSRTGNMYHTRLPPPENKKAKSHSHCKLAHYYKYFVCVLIFVEWDFPKMQVLAFVVKT